MHSPALAPLGSIRGGQHDDKFTAKSQHTVNLPLRLFDLSRVMQNSMLEDHVECVISERQLQAAAWPKLSEGQVPRVNRAWSPPTQR